MFHQAVVAQVQNSEMKLLLFCRFQRELTPAKVCVATANECECVTTATVCAVTTTVRAVTTTVCAVTTNVRAVTATYYTVCPATVQYQMHDSHSTTKLQARLRL